MSTTNEQLPIVTSTDVVLVRTAVRTAAERMGLRHIDVTKLVTAASEIARNTLIYGGGGTAAVECLQTERKAGVRVTFEDQGPGIADLQLALRQGYTTGGGLGLGLGGSQKLVDEFEIQSEAARGTRVTMTKWR